MSLGVGTKLGPFEIVAPLGAGGMGEVYRARDTKLGRDVALKALPEAVVHDAERIARFQREAQILASLSHPNIAAIYGLEESGGVRALAMELVEGPTLAERLAATHHPLAPSSGRRGIGEPPPGSRGGQGVVEPAGMRKSPLQLDEALPIARQIAEALEYAHERGIIHRDLKPANVKVRPDGTVKVLDFGLAKALAAGDSSSDISNSPTLTMAATQAGVIIGTAAYMSPEQAKGKTVDRRADIWAFGCVLFEMLTGQKVFDGETTSEALAAVIKDEPEWSALPASTPAGIQRLLRRCLTKEPKVRLRDIGEARIAIEEMLRGKGEDAVAAAPSPSQSAMWTSPLQRLLWPLAGTCALLLAALVGLALKAGIFHKAAPAVGTVRFSISPPEGYSLSPAITFAQAAVSPDGQRIAMALADSKGKTSLWVRPLSGTTAQKFDNTDGAILPFWSPDSQSIGFFTDTKLEKVPATGGSPQPLCDAKTGTGGTWSQDGVILFGLANGPIMRASADGGEPTPVTDWDPAKFGSNVAPHFLPDGKHFVYLGLANAAQNNSIFLGSLDSRQAKPVLQGASEARFYPPGQLLYVRGGTLFAQPFDLGRGSLTGEPIRVAENVNVAFWGAASFSVSNNGVLAFCEGGSSQAGQTAQLIWYNRQGKKLAPVGPPGAYFQAVLSPNERTVALEALTDPKDSQNSDIWQLDLSNGVYSRLTFDPAQESDPTWSPDSRKIIYEVIRAGKGEFMELELGASQPTKLYADGKASYLDDWSADGKWVIYHDGDNLTFHALPMTSEHVPTQLWHDTFARDQIHFSPDGKWLAYSSNESGRLEVYVAAFPSLDKKRQVSNAGGAEPIWRHDGKELFYLSLDGNLMAVPVNAGAAMDTGLPKMLFRADAVNPYGNFDVTSYNVSRDGQKFLILEPVKQSTNAGIEQINVIVNWDAALGK